jgi:thiosulfate/3-mercaptopyruvate sulfurtransferase
MKCPHLPLLTTSDQLAVCQAHPLLRVIDLSHADRFQKAHIPGAVHLDYQRLVYQSGDAQGLLPDAQQVSYVLSSLGLTPDHHVVAYDDENGAKACRLLWTLDVVGHRYGSLLDGGLTAWQDAHQPVTTDTNPVGETKYPVTLRDAPVADHAYIMARLGNPDTVLVDARTAEEYTGELPRAARCGHIPGAVNIDWIQHLDPRHLHLLKPEMELRQLYSDAGVSPDREVITYCHTHRRSAHSYFVLKLLGYRNIKAYPGSWSEWGNLAETPIEQTT